MKLFKKISVKGSLKNFAWWGGRGRKFALIVFIVLMGGCATPSGPLATLPVGSPIAADYNLKGIQSYNLGKWGEAMAKFEQALQADPQMAEAHFNLALTLHKLGRHEEAKQEFEKAGELSPDNQYIVGTVEYRNHLGLSSTFERHMSGGYRY